MQSKIELHDSDVTSCQEIGDDVVIRLSPAILHRSSGSAGVDSGDVFTLAVEIRCIDATIVDPFEDFPTELECGALVVDGSTFDNCIPFPLDVRGNIMLRLDDFPGRAMQITSRGCILCAVSDEVYLESFPGSDA